MYSIYSDKLIARAVLLQYLEEFHGVTEVDPQITEINESAFDLDVIVVYRDRFSKTIGPVFIPLRWYVDRCYKVAAASSLVAA